MAAFLSHVSDSRIWFSAGSLLEHLNKQENTREFKSVVTFTSENVSSDITKQRRQEEGLRSHQKQQQQQFMTTNKMCVSLNQFERLIGGEVRTLNSPKIESEGFCVMSDIYTVYTTWFFRINFSCGGNSRTIFV